MYQLEQDEQTEPHIVDAQSINSDYQAPQFRRYRHISEGESGKETLYMTISEEDPHERFWHDWKRHHLLQYGVQVLALFLLAAFTFMPDSPSYQTQTILIPAFFSTQVFHAESRIIPTGKKVSPATHAHGVLTIYNGSFLAQQMPKGLLIITAQGEEIMIDESVTIPPANPPAFGVASAPAHSVQAGKQGNIPSYAVQQTVSTSLYLQNLTAFTGGRDERVEFVLTADDRQQALENARSRLLVQRPIGLLKTSCKEAIRQQNQTLQVSWACVYAHYQAPKHAEVLSANIQGEQVLLTIRVIVLPQ